MKEQAIRQKLAALAKVLGLRMPEVQLLLCQERFLARLGSIPEGRSFIWKGGSLMLRLYRMEGIPRYTIDLDFTIKGLSVADVDLAFKKAMETDLDDGFTFTTIQKEPMQRDLPYGGDRFELEWTFFAKRGSRKLAIDACAGDVVKPNIVSAKDAFILPIGSENIEFSIYPKEFIFAEKLETAFRFKTGNSRCKDFIDMWVLLKGNLEKEVTRQAVSMCFTNRKTEFSLEEARRIFLDNLFQERLEKQRLRYFAELSVPAARTILLDLMTFLESF